MCLQSNLVLRKSSLVDAKLGKKITSQKLESLIVQHTCCIPLKGVKSLRSLFSHHCGHFCNAAMKKSHGGSEPFATLCSI